MRQTGQPAADMDPGRSGLRGERVAFTGKLATIPRRDACALVERAGGETVRGVSRRTSILVVGMYGWPLLPDGSLNRSLRRAEELNRPDRRIVVASERDFVRRLGSVDGRRIAESAYSPVEIHRLMGITTATLRRWEELGLIRAHDGRFDLLDIVSLRTLSELVSRGVREDVVQRSLRTLAGVLPRTDRALSQLEIVCNGPCGLLAEIEAALAPADGQLMLDFGVREADAGADEFTEHAFDAAPLAIRFQNPDEPSTAEGWFTRATAWEEEDRFADAEAAYRRALALQPQFPEAHFNLGNVLREMGRLEAAAERYHVATELAPQLAEAWYNLGDLCEDQGRLDEAIRYLTRAIEARPDYADAYYNLAHCYEALGRADEARQFWRQYVRLDPSGPWAEQARRYICGPNASAQACVAGPAWALEI